MSKNSKTVICTNCNEAISKNVKICPSCGTKNKRSFSKKACFIILVIILVIGVIGCGNKNGHNKDNGIDKAEEYSMPNSAIGSMIPQPDSPYGKVIYESEDRFWIDVYDISGEQFENYIDTCKNFGFTVDYNKFDNYYSAKDEDGYSLSLTYNADEETLSISMNAPTDKSESQENEDTENTEGTSSQEEPSSEETIASKNEEPNTSESEDNDNQELVDGMRPEFKEAMDSYEAFYDEYCNFMKKYAENPTDLELLTEYTDMVSKLAEMDKKFEAWDEDEMNNTELKYYLEVNTRVTQKLLEVAE